MNHRQHIWLTIFFSGGLGLLLWKLKLENLLIYSIPMFVFANVPDLIEPAIKNPNHRRFFHSKKMFKFLSVCLGILLIMATFKSPTYYYYFFGVLGYQLHLIADAVTWKGLPN